MKTKKEVITELVMARAACADGFASSDAGVNTRYARKVAKDLADAGKLFCAKNSQNIKINYFTSAKAAAKYSRKSLPVTGRVKSWNIPVVETMTKKKKAPEIKGMDTVKVQYIKSPEYTKLNPLLDIIEVPVRKVARCNAAEVMA